MLNLCQHSQLVMFGLLPVAAKAWVSTGGESEGGGVA